MFALNLFKEDNWLMTDLYYGNWRVDFKVMLNNTYTYLQGGEHYALFPMLKIWVH